MSRCSLLDAFSLKIRFFSSEPQRILNEILKRNIPVWGIEHGDGVVSFQIFPTRKKHFTAFCEKLKGGERWEEEPLGILHLLCVFRKRIGFFCGLAFLALSLFLSTRFLWGVDVVGNVQIPSHQIRKQLSEYGLSPGKLLANLDAKEIALRFDIDHNEYTYVGINVVGTRARVEIRERENMKEEILSFEGASNQVARIYGKIIRYEVLSGQIEVKKGDYVKEGDLLISGIRETKNGSFYPVRAVGRVFAETRREFSVTVPLEEIARSYIVEEKKQTCYEILGITLSFPAFLSEKDEGCEVLEFVEPLTLFGYELPVVERERIFLKTIEKKDTIKVDRAEDLAYDKYEQFKRDTFAESDEILSENLSVYSDETGVTLTAELSAIENICRESPFRFQISP